MPPRVCRVRFPWSSLVLAGCGLLAVYVAPAHPADPPPRIPASWPKPAEVGRDEPPGGAEAEPGQEPGAAGEEAGRSEGEGKQEEQEKDGPLDPVFDLIDPARLQRDLDQALGARFERRRSRRELPEVPEIGEPVFFDLTRPLGARQYSNELNYLLNPSTATAPTLQVIEYEYAFADWNAVELDLQYYNKKLEILTPFYQRTLGVGPSGRSVHGIQVSPDIYLRTGFLGGSAVYVHGWKPTRESKFSTLTFVGVNRQLIGGFLRLTSGALPTPPTTTSRQTADGPIYGAWRPTWNIDLFYQISEKFTLGMENDLFFGAGRAGEYLSFPFVTWEAGQHSFFQAGGGYYHFEGRDQFTFLLHLNFVNPSVKVSDEDARGEKARRSAPTSEATASDSPRSGPIRRWIERYQANR